MKEAIITITIGTIIGGTIGTILYKILCSDCTPYIITFQKGIESMDEDKIKKLLDDIDASCQEGWDDDQRGNFYDIMNITKEIKKELK